jgi:hypothetical protein
MFEINSILEEPDYDLFLQKKNYIFWNWGFNVYRKVVRRTAVFSLNISHHFYLTEKRCKYIQTSSLYY